MQNKNLGKGCLPVFVLVITLVIIGIFIPSKISWKSELINLTVFLYWFGVAYILIVVMINKLNEPKKLSNSEILTASIEKNN